MSDVDEIDDEDFGEAGEAGEGGTAAARNPVGVYYGQRNDKNERHGRGRAELPNGDLYLGCYYRGQRHGLGIYRYKNGNGARYGGDWTFGEKKGWGTMYYPDGAQYTGNWDRNLRHGWGVYVYPNGDEYEGWWYYGRRNGRGIYRTKANSEKFVGEWRLGKRHGPGMLIRKDHRFIGHWFNDVPRGPGVYIFPELQCEQHGRYTHMKVAPGGEDRWRLAGYQVPSIRSTPPFPLDDPHAIETQHKSVIEVQSEVDGEGRVEDLKQKTQSPTISIETRVFNYMMNILEQDAIADDTKISVVPMWRAIQVTGLITPIPDDSVPPPPLPPTPRPPTEPEPESKEEEEEGEGEGEGEEEGYVDPILEAKRLAETHALQETYYGQGVCQPDTLPVKLPPEVEPYANFSAMSLSNMKELREAVEATGGQLEPIDIEAAMRENQAQMKSHGLDVEDRWRNCLGDDDPNCQLPEAPAAPGGLDELKEPQQARRTSEQHRSQAQSRATSELPASSAIDEDETRMSETGDEGDEENGTTDDY